MKPTRKLLLALFDRLGRRDQNTLIAFAQFLCQRQDEPAAATLEAPLARPGPPSETVPAALKRLKASYYMLDAAELLAEAAELMSAHVLQGKEAAEIIAALESLFERHYQTYKSEQGQ